MRLVLAVLVIALAPATVAWAQVCRADIDCSLGNVCQRDPGVPVDRIGICKPDPRTPRKLLIPQGVAAPRTDRDPSTRIPTTAANPTGYAQCTTDRDCPDGYSCTRRSTNEAWYCRRR
jgi:hypothetical protein